MHCEMCGREADVHTTLVEGSRLQLCQSCGGHGNVLKPPVSTPRRHVIQAAPDVGIVDNYSSVVRKARTRSGLTQEDFAKRLNEKASVISKIEAGNFEPSIQLARKLERLLHITLVEETEPAKIATRGRSSDEGFTIGDILRKE